MTLVPCLWFCWSFEKAPLGGLVPLGVGSSDTGILDGVALSLFLKVMHCHTLSSEEMSDSAEGLCTV